MKETICTIIGIVGGAVATLFGGWDASLMTLLIFMGIDYVSGLVLAGVFHKSKKSENGALENGKYYTQDGATYLCTRDTGNPVYNALADLVGIYVDTV